MMYHTKGIIALAVLFVLMLMLAMCQGCSVIGKTHFLDMSDQWCAARPAAPAWRNCKVRDNTCNPNPPPHCDPWQ